MLRMMESQLEHDMETGLIQGLYWEQLGLEAQVLWSRIKGSRLKHLDII